MAEKRYIKFLNEKIYDAKTFYERVKNRDEGIYFGGGYIDCHVGSGKNEKVPKIFYVESNLPEFFCQRGFLYFPDDKKICCIGADRSGYVDAIIIYSHGLILFVFADKKKNRMEKYKSVDINILHHRLIVEHFYLGNLVEARNQLAFRKLTFKK